MSADDSLSHHQIDQADAVAWLKTLSNESVDLIVTDPAYESLEKHRAVGTTTRLKKEWFPIFPNARFEPLFAEMYRVLKKNSHCYILCDQETMFAIKPFGEKAGFKFWKPIIWDKVSIGMGYHYRCRYECVLFFEKGKRRLTSLSTPDVLTIPRVRGGYPTEKPAALFNVLIGQSAKRGELVVDPFVGSGASAQSAVSLGMSFLGCDINPAAVALATERMTAHLERSSRAAPVPQGESAEDRNDSLIAHTMMMGRGGF